MLFSLVLLFASATCAVAEPSYWPSWLTLSSNFASTDACAVGDKVKANWKGLGAYYEAVIHSINSDGTITVGWNLTGQTRHAMAASQVRKNGKTCQSPKPHPTPPTPAPPSPRAPKCWDENVNAGKCESPNTCPDEVHVGKWSVYVVPCDDGRVDDLYNMDPGWGGAHITMTSFQDESADSAKSKFKKLQGDLHSKGQKWIWKPLTFSAQMKSNGAVRLGIASNNLDDMISSLSKAGWKSPTKKDNWHVTLTSMTNKKFTSHDATYKTLTHWFEKMPQHWAVVLVKCHKGKNGEIRFHREDGFTVHEWTNSEINV